MENLNELTDLARKVDIILKEELSRGSIEYDMAEARIYNAKRVGVQGDARTYRYPAEITLFQKMNFVWDEEFLRRLSTRITNEITDVNTVLYVTAKKD